MRVSVRLVRARSVSLFLVISLSLTLAPVAYSQPSDRAAPALAFDSNRGVTVLFGGRGMNGSQLFGDTWEWDGVRWTQVATSGPSPRYTHAMVFDSTRGVTVLFGGLDANSQRLGDTWEWNGSQWTRVATSGPAPRYTHAMAFDSSRNTTVLFGGFTNTRQRDTWEWNGVSWTLKSGGGLSPRTGHAMAFDAANRVTILFGGVESDQGQGLGDTWQWDGSVWTRLATSGPAGRYFHAMAFDQARRRIVLYGGCVGGGVCQPSGDTWEWNGSNWERVATMGPSARNAPGFAYDSTRGVTVLFGGGPEPHGDTWEWDGARWRERDTQQLPHADLPNEPGTGTTFTRWTRDGGEERNIPFVAIKWNRPTAVLIHGWNSQGYLPREEATYWIRQFKDVATDKITGAFRGQQGEAGAQIVVIDWNDRADPLWGYTNRDIWLSARNGYADGQLIGRALSELPTQDVDADRLHLIGHSNGSAFAAGIAFSFHELTGRAIGQLTAIEAPSEAEMNVPTGVFVQNASAVVQYFENWAYSGENPGEVGEQMWGGNTTNILASISHTFEITIDRAYYLLHSKLPLRYARSARYGLSYSESSFTDHSVTLGWTPLAPGVWRELNTNRWRFEGEPRWHPAERLRRGFTFESDPLSWRGQNAWHIGGPGELAFRCDGTGDLYVEFVIQPDEMSEGWTNLMTWELRVLEPFYKPVYVFCDDEYVGSVEVNGQTGFFPIQRTLLAYQLSEHPIKIGFWVPNDNGQSRAFEIGYVGIYETNYYITGN